MGSEADNIAALRGRKRGRAAEHDDSVQLQPRIPPHSIEAEESVIGGILLDNETLNVALEKLRPEDFYKPSHALIFQAMMSLVDKREPIDIVTIGHRLRAMGQSDEQANFELLSHLAAIVPTSAHVGYYARLVKEFSLRRKVIREASEITNEAFHLEGEVEAFLDKTEQRILSVSDYRIAPAFFKVGDVVTNSIKLIEKLYDKKEPITGVPSGFIDLDKMTAGFQQSDLIIIAARPSMGKTALSLCMGSHVGLHEKKGVAVFSLEMSKEQLVLRMLCSEARVDHSRVRTGHLFDNDFPRLVEAAGLITEAPIFIDDTPALTVTELRAKCRRLNRESPLSLIIIDYLQLMRSPAYSHSREQEISDISRSLKGLAKELHVPVVALSQLNRSVENRENKRPVMSDLRESGAIEQDADIIMFIYRDEVYHKDTTEKGIAELIIAKQRNGPTGTVKLAFAGEHTRFENLLMEYEGGGFPGGSPSDPSQGGGLTLIKGGSPQPGQNPFGEEDGPF